MKAIEMAPITASRRRTKNLPRRTPETHLNRQLPVVKQAERPIENACSAVHHRLAACGCSIFMRLRIGIVLTAAFGVLAVAGASPARVTGVTISDTRAVADSYVNNTSSQTRRQNYGSAIELKAQGAPEMRSYLRFNVSGLSGVVTNATLRLYARASSSTGYSVRGVAQNSWNESTITWRNAPAVSPTITASSGPLSAGVWSEVNVTPLVNGNGTFSFALTSTAATAVSLASRETGANAPELIVQAVDDVPPSVLLTSPANGANTSDTTPFLAGTGGTLPGDTPSVTVKVYAGSTPTGTPVQTRLATVGAGGSFAVEASPALAEGTYTARAEQTDVVGNVGLSNANTFTIVPPGAG